jgi:ribosome biogenesis GTPase A
MFGQKARVLVFTKCDLADAAQNRAWQEWYSANKGERVFFVDAQSGSGLSSLVPGWQEIVARRRRNSGAVQPLRRPVRVMIAGIPNVGKSTLVNRLSVSRRAAVGPRPGVTRNQQWIPLKGGLELLDTPGVLWPRIKSKEMELRLGLVGTIKDELTGPELLAEYLWWWARQHPGQVDFSIYRPEGELESAADLLEAVGRRRGFLGAGGVIDIGQSASVLLSDFRAGKLGRVTFDPVPAAD